MAAKTPFHVHAYPGDLLGKFPNETDAIRVAQVWSKIWGGWAEVIRETKVAGGIIAQFDKGELTPEFADRQEHLRPWLDHCGKAFA